MNSKEPYYLLNELLYQPVTKSAQGGLGNQNNVQGHMIIKEDQKRSHAPIQN